MDLRNRAPQILACLADPVRFRFASDVVRGDDMSTLAASYGTTVAQKHIERLQSCGLVELEDGSIKVQLKAFAQALDELRLLRIAARGPAPLDRPDINECFQDGRLHNLPQNEGRLGALLSWIAERYFPHGPWNEREVDLILKTFADDHATLRRQLIDNGRLVRTPDGAEYRSVTTT